MIAGTIALNFCGPAAMFVAEQIPGIAAYVFGLMFVLIYGAALLLLRWGFDHFLTERVRFPINIDRVGAVAIGLFTGVLVAGAMSFAAQTMPFKADFLGYDREKTFLGIQPDATFLSIMHHTSTKVLDGPGVHMRPPTDIRNDLWKDRGGEE